QKDCFISNHTKAKILIKATDAQSLTDIAKDCLVSTSTVQRVITTEAKKHHKQYQYLPKHLSFDEFKYKKGQMAFEYVDEIGRASWRGNSGAERGGCSV